MKVNVEHAYPHSLAAVYGAFSDPAFYVAKFEALGDKNVTVLDSDTSKNEFQIEIERDVRLDVPGLLRSALGEWNTLRQTERWTKSGDGYANELALHSDLVPMKIGGTMQLSGNANKCVNRVEMEIKSSIPLLGRKLEQFGAQNTSKSLEEEYAFITKYLAANAGPRPTKKKVKKKAKKKAKKKSKKKG